VAAYPWPYFAFLGRSRQQEGHLAEELFAVSRRVTWCDGMPVTVCHRPAVNASRNAGLRPRKSHQLIRAANWNSRALWADLI
jgi:hypothetical protein